MKENSEIKRTIDEWQELEKPQPIKMTKQEYKKYSKKVEKISIVGVIMVATAILGITATALAGPSFYQGIIGTIIGDACIVAFILGFVLMICAHNIDP